MSLKALPGASGSQTFGIISIVLALICCSPIGGIFGFIGLMNAKKAERLYMQNPEEYMGYEQARTGKTLSIIGLVLAILSILVLLLFFGPILAFFLLALGMDSQVAL